MLNPKSYAEFILGLYDAQLKDCAAQYPALAKEFTRDYTRLSSAVESHGIRFALDTLVTWRKHFDLCLSNGRLTRTNLLHFSSWKRGGTVPKLFRGLVLRVFDLDGTLKADPDSQAILLIRQLCGAVRKLRVPCGPKADSESVRDFIRTDQEVRLGHPFWEDLGELPEDASSVSLVDDTVKVESSNQAFLPGFLPQYLPYRHAECIQQVADYMMACLGYYNPTDMRFRHGPGAVSDQGFGEYKYSFKNWPERLDEVFPMADFAVANYSHWFDSSLYKSPSWVTSKEYPAKLCAVPKTIKTPRLIASEPTSFQWCQQNIRDFMYTRVRGSHIGSFVDFHRQEANGALALEASRSQSHCTIDLSSASDRISCWLVERVFRRSPQLLAALRASRSKFIKQDICGNLPRYLYLRKFSTMGNAVTFPVQSLVFLSICLGSLCFLRGLKVNGKTLRSFGGNTVRVFGDDLIVPKDCAGATLDALIAFGLKVNASKTFTEGNFRESCGIDAYGGKNVTTVSILDAPMKAKPGSIVSSVDVHNNLCVKGYYHTARYIQKTVERTGYKKIRDVAHGSGSFGWYPNYLSDRPSLRTKYDSSLQLRLVRCFVLRTKQRRIQPSEYSSVLQFFTEAPRKVTSGLSTLGHPVRRAKVSLTLGWAPLV